MSTRPTGQFWQIIGELNGQANAEVMAALIEHLAWQGPSVIIDFAEDLAAALHAIDTRLGMSQPIGDCADSLGVGALPLSETTFLAARCAVVLAGKAVWDKVVADPHAMAGRWDLAAEDLLHIAPAAYAHATGSDWTHRTEVNCATGSNSRGWQ